MGIRANIVSNASARDQYIEGCLRLKAEFLGPTTRDFGIAGPNRQVSTWDLFVIWHHTAMFTFTPPGQDDRNAAHRGPAFLPWHRHMLLLLEQQLQRVLADSDFGLPYWNWAADGDRPAAQQRQSAIWAANCMGGSGSPVTTGPFVAAAFPVRIVATSGGVLTQASRGLRRSLGTQVRTLPPRVRAAVAVRTSPYDAAPWSTASTGFRNRLEGWPSGPALHNRVHVWVGGDMLPSSSPNDPVFYLNHCNVDRLWEAWMQRAENGRSYLPLDSESAALQGHRLSDALFSLISAAATPSQMLNLTASYTYDSLAV